jgi:hypothetical protein
MQKRRERIEKVNKQLMYGVLKDSGIFGDFMKWRLYL